MTEILPSLVHAGPCRNADHLPAQTGCGFGWRSRLGRGARTWDATGLTGGASVACGCGMWVISHWVRSCPFWEGVMVVLLNSGKGQVTALSRPLIGIHDVRK